MALSPTYCSSVITNCTILKIIDDTGVYNASTNTGGWGTPNAQGSDITEATISYKIGDGDYVDVDITTNIPDTVVGDFVAAEITLDGYEDGYMTILYTLTTADATYTKKYIKIFTCNSRCCIDAMWSDISEICDCNCDIEEKISDALMAEGLLRAVKSAASCNVSTGVTSMLAKIKKLCDWENCNCS